MNKINSKSKLEISPFNKYEISPSKNIGRDKIHEFRKIVGKKVPDDMVLNFLTTNNGDLNKAVDHFYDDGHSKISYKLCAEAYIDKENTDCCSKYMKAKYM